MKRLYDFLGSYGLSCALIVLLFLLTLLGTLEQSEHGLYEVQKKYFESLVVVEWLGGLVPIPLPGAYLILVVLTINLIVGGLIKIRKNAATAGVIVVHAGVLILVAAAFVKVQLSEEGSLTLYEHQRSNEFESYHEWEIAIYDASQTADVAEHIIPEADFADLAGARSATFEDDDLPFRIALSHFESNCSVLPKGPMWEAVSPTIDGFALKREPSKDDQNAAGLVARIDTPDGSHKEGLLWALARAPFVVDAGGKSWAIDIRKKRHSMPFTIELDRFTRELHPRMQMARVFKSEVTKIEGGTSEKRTIEMNEPLRHEGLILFQASWGPEDGKPGELFSTFAVVRNPSDRWPLAACIVITAGMALAFTQKLLRYTRAQRARRPS